MNRSISTLSSGSRTLDGGVMFGATPRKDWAAVIEPDHENQVQLPSRALLVQQGDKNILVLAGTDALLAPLPRTCRCQKHTHGLLDSLARHGLGEHDIHAVVLTHLQALVSAELRHAIEDGDTPRLLFPTARYITGRRHWLRALRPHPRDRALFINPILGQLQVSERLELVDETSDDVLGSGWRFHFSDGHTPGQLLPEIDLPGGCVVFAGDLIPGTHWLSLDAGSGFDRNPEGLADEKERLLDHLVAKRGRLVLARDPSVAMIKVMRDRKARYAPYDQYARLRSFDN